MSRAHVERRAALLSLSGNSGSTLSILTAAAPRPSTYHMVWAPIPDDIVG
jgi:hypothetical protein